MGWLVEKALTFCWGEMGEVDVDADVNGMLGEAVPARSSQIGVVLCRERSSRFVLTAHAKCRHGVRRRVVLPLQ